MKTPIQELLSIVSDLKTRGENDGTSDGLIIKTCMNMVEKIINDEALIEKEKKAILKRAIKQLAAESVLKNKVESSKSLTLG